MSIRWDYQIWWHATLMFIRHQYAMGGVTVWSGSLVNNFISASKEMSVTFLQCVFSNVPSKESEQHLLQQVLVESHSAQLELDLRQSTQRWPPVSFSLFHLFSASFHNSASQPKPILLENRKTPHQGHHQGLNMADQSNVFVGEDSSSTVAQRWIPQNLLQFKTFLQRRLAGRWEGLVGLVLTRQVGQQGNAAHLGEEG